MEISLQICPVLLVPGPRRELKPKPKPRSESTAAKCLSRLRMRRTVVFAEKMGSFLTTDACWSRSFRGSSTYLGQARKQDKMRNNS